MFMEIIGKSEYIFEMILIETILATYFTRKPRFLLRFLAGVCVCFGFTVLSILRSFSMWGSIPLVIISFFLTLGMMKLCYEEQFWKILFTGVAAFIMQSIIYSIYIMIVVAFCPEPNPVQHGILYLIILLAAICILRFYFAEKLRLNSDITVDNRLLTLLVFIAGIIDTVFKFYMIDHGLGGEAGGVFLVWKGFSMLACIFILCVQFGILKQRSLRAENARLETLLCQQQKQYEISRENIELINIKCHDLKHWLNRLKEMKGDDFEQEAEEMKKALAIYDSTIRTGNEMLDTILTECKLRCEYNKINMTCIADGRNLSVLSTAEICSLFGNILENAIEAVLKIEDPPGRSINLLVKSTGSFLSIHEENYYSEDLLLTKDGFVTTKDDKNYHGFGLRSIRMIVEKHHGDVSFNAEAGIFNVNILIPLPE